MPPRALPTSPELIQGTNSAITNLKWSDHKELRPVPGGGGGSFWDILNSMAERDSSCWDSSVIWKKKNKNKNKFLWNIVPNEHRFAMIMICNLGCLLSACLPVCLSVCLSVCLPVASAVSAVTLPCCRPLSYLSVCRQVRDRCFNWAKKKKKKKKTWAISISGRQWYQSAELLTWCKITHMTS